MSVVPGEGGQNFISESEKKIKYKRKKKEENNKEEKKEVDGGINDKTAEIARNAGADILVSGSYILNSGDSKKAIRNLKGEV